MKHFYKKKILIFIIFIYFFLLLWTKKESVAYEDSVEKRINLWPVLVFTENKLSSFKRIEVLGPFFYNYSGIKENGTSVRPFISWVSTSKVKKTFFLSPLGLYKSEPERKTFKLIPLLSKSVEKGTSENFERGDHFDMFPFFVGKTSKGETYGGIFPFYGKFKERFGKKEITFILWPFYTKVKYEDHVSQNYLWPFIKSIHGKEYSGFKVWPIYGRFKEKERERKFFLWPFYIKESTYYPDGDFEEKWMIFPFYIKENQPGFQKRIVLWPFFQKIYIEDPLYNQIDAPWPFYRKIEGENIRGFRLWPFYGYVKREDSLESFVFWPLYFYYENTFVRGNSSYHDNQYKFFLFSKAYSQYYDERLTKSEFRLWPFYYSYDEPPQELHLSYFPAIFPFYDEGVERNYAPFFKIIEYYKKRNYIYLKLFWGLYRYEKEGERQVQELAFLIRRVIDVNTNYIEFGEGFLGLGKIEGKPVMKVLFIKIIK